MNGSRAARVLVAQPIGRPHVRGTPSRSGTSLDMVPLSVGLVRGPNGSFTLLVSLELTTTAEEALRDLAPRARVADAGETAELPIVLVRDERTVDADKGLVVLRWRAMTPCGPLPMARGAEEPPFDHVLVSLEVDSAPRRLPALSGAAAWGQLSFASEEGAPASPDEADELRMARYAAWESCTTPALTLRDYAFVAAELAEAREPRGETFARHGLSEDSWTYEERAWLQKMGDRAMDGDGTLAVEYAEAFTAAQDELATPEEQKTTLDEYVAVRARLQRAEDPTPVLRERGMTLPRWLRLDRRFSEQAREDRALAAEIERRTAAEIARLGPLPDD